MLLELDPSWTRPFAHMFLVVIMMVMSLLDLTPRVFKEFEAVKQVSHSFRQQRRVLVFWRRRRFWITGFNTAGKAIAALEDTRFAFAEAPYGKHEEMCGVPASRLKVKVFVQALVPTSGSCSHAFKNRGLWFIRTRGNVSCSPCARQSQLWFWRSTE